MSTTAELASHIDALLPQTQCTRCGYPTCRDYADAIAGGEADIDRCPPGGTDGIAALAKLLGRATKPLDPTCGVEQPPLVALIEESVCIGCTKCIQACPVDAIVGAAKRMHTVIADECTGCELCVPPCPVDCITLVPTADQPLPRAHVLLRAGQARKRYEAREARLDRAQPTVSAGIPPTATPPGIAAGTIPPSAATAPTAPITRSAVLEAISRGRARKNST